MTRQAQCEEALVDDVRVKIVDTIGVDDTRLSISQVLHSIAQVCYREREKKSK